MPEIRVLQTAGPGHGMCTACGLGVGPGATGAAAATVLRPRRPRGAAAVARQSRPISSYPPHIWIRILTNIILRPIAPQLRGRAGR